MSNKANAKAQLREAKDIEIQLRKELRRLRRRTEAEATTMTTQTHKFARAFTAMKEAKHASDSKLAAVQAELSRVNLNVGVMERLHRAEVEQLHTEYAKQRKSMQKASERLIAAAAKSGHVAATAKLASSGLSAAATRRISRMAAGGGDDGEGGATMLVHESTAALPLETASKQRPRVQVRDGEDEDRRRLAVPAGRRGAGTSTAALPLETASKQRSRVQNFFEGRRWLNDTPRRHVGTKAIVVDAISLRFGFILSR